MKNFITVLFLIVLVSLGIYLFSKKSTLPKVDVKIDTAQSEDNKQTSETPEVEKKDESKTVIGKSVEGRDITAYHYGKGEREILLVGGIHGGYSWNTALLGYEMVDYLEANPNVVPSKIKVTIIPVLNPDGLNKVAGTSDRFDKSDVSTSQTVLVSGRFNTSKVDLSRNFDCEWQSTGMWQTTKVSGGAKAFSEPESLAIKSYIEKNKPDAVVVWYSAAGGVYASSCGSVGILPETSALSEIYAKASGYPKYDSFDFYETSGDMVNWLAKIKIPGISVLLTTHSDTELEKNKKGIEAVLQYYGK